MPASTKTRRPPLCPLMYLFGGTPHPVLTTPFQAGLPYFCSEFAGLRVAVIPSRRTPQTFNPCALPRVHTPGLCAPQFTRLPGTYHYREIPPPQLFFLFYVFVASLVPKSQEARGVFRGYWVSLCVYKACAFFRTICLVLSVPVYGTLLFALSLWAHTPEGRQFRLLFYPPFVSRSPRLSHLHWTPMPSSESLAQGLLLLAILRVRHHRIGHFHS